MKSIKPTEIIIRPVNHAEIAAAGFLSGSITTLIIVLLVTMFF